MSTAHTQPETAPDLADVCHELKGAITGRYHDLYAGAMAIIGRRCSWMKGSARQDWADSIVQEAITRAWEHRGKFDKTRQPVAWLMGFVNKVALEKIGKRTRQVSQTDLGDERWKGAMAGLITPMTDVGSLDLLRLARQKLSPDQQHILTLAYDEGLDGAELAERLGTTPGAARVAKFRALQALRNIFLQLDGSGGRQS